MLELSEDAMGLLTCAAAIVRLGVHLYCAL